MVGKSIVEVESMGGITVGVAGGLERASKQAGGAREWPTASGHR